MPEIFRWPTKILVEKLHEWKSLGIKCFALFPHIVPSKKDPTGSEILFPTSLIYRAAREIKDKIKEKVSKIGEQLEKIAKALKLEL